MTDKVILGIETCTNICSVALWDGQSLYESINEVARSHSKTLLPMIEKVLEKAQKTIKAVDLVACSQGPGSFTGVRIGVGVAKGIAYGQNIDIIPVSSLAAVAYQAMRCTTYENITVLLDARMGELYAADYIVNDGLPVLQGQERLTNIDDLSIGQQLFAGTGAIEYQDQLIEKGATLSAVMYPLATDIVELAKTSNTQLVSAADFAPVYLRNKVTD